MPGAGLPPSVGAGGGSACHDPPGSAGRADAGGPVTDHWSGEAVPAAADQAGWEALRESVWEQVDTPVEAPRPPWAPEPRTEPPADEVAWPEPVAPLHTPRAGSPHDAGPAAMTEPVEPPAREHLSRPVEPVAPPWAPEPLPVTAAPMPAPNEQTGRVPAARTSTQQQPARPAQPDRSQLDRSAPLAAHKTVPRPTSPARRRQRGPLRPSELPYRIGFGRRFRSSLALIVLTAVTGLVVSAVAIAVIAGLASAISSAASS